MGRWRAILAVLLLLGSCLSAAAQNGETYLIHVDVEQKRLTLFQGAQTIKAYTVATGARDTPTPVGVFTITRRFSGDMCGFGTCFLGLDVPWGDYGIHGTNKPESIGYDASHGCIRMAVRDAEELYKIVPNGTKVVIECGPFGELGPSLRPLKNGDRSAAVRAVQRKLKALGFYDGWPDGIFGSATQRAVNRARQTYGLSPNGLLDWSLYQAIGLMVYE